MEARKLQLDVLRATLTGRHFLRKPPKPEKRGRAGPSGGSGGSAAAADDAAYPGIDADNDDLDFGVFDSHVQKGAALGGDDHGEDMLQLTNTWEDERDLKEDMDKRIDSVTAPPVVARADGALDFRCHACGQSGGFSVQLPLNIFSTAYRTANSKVAINCLVELSNMLIRGEYAEVYQRTTCCKKLQCLLGQDLISADDYCTWAQKVKRPQLERGTDRKHQSRIFCENLVLLRVLATSTPRVMTNKQLRALFEFLVLNSQFIQEREKRFIATAMAAVGHTEVFPYKFGDPQSVVERMAQIPRNYASRVIFPHVLVSGLNSKKWVSKGNKLLETAFPKAADALFVILCLENAKANEHEVVDGRMVHRVPHDAKYASLFTPEGFHKALWLACGGEKPHKYTLRFASSGRDLRETTSYGNTRTQREYHRMLTALTSKQRSDTTTGKGAPAAFTCGSLQADSGVHPKARYLGVLKALGYSDEEAEETVALFLDEHPSGNTVGFEKLNKDSPLAKACATVRPVELVKKRVPAVYNSSRARLNAQAIAASTDIKPVAKKSRM